MTALQLRTWSDHQRDRRPIHRHVLLRGPAAFTAALAIAVAGCGDGGGAGGDDHHRLIAAIGDSITAGNPGFDPHPALRRQLGLGDDPESQWEYWAEKEHPDLQFRNCGGRGERTDEIARRLEDCAAGADGIVIQGGINDLATGSRPQAVLQNLREMVRAAQRDNLDVAVADVLPYGPAPQADRVIEQLNREIAAMGHRAGAAVLPFHRVLEDPEHPGLMKPGWTADGIHPSVEGYRRLGEIAFQPPG